MYTSRTVEYHQSVPSVIRSIFASNNLYYQALLSGIANYTALAQRIKPDVEKITGIEVQIGTIVVAIKRFADTLIKQQQEEQQLQERAIMNNRVKGARLSLIGSVIDVDFNDKEFEEIFNLLDEVFEKEGSGRYNLFQTNKQLRLFAEDIEETRNILLNASKKFDGRVKEGLSKITITLPASSTSHSSAATAPPYPSDNRGQQQQYQKPYYHDMLSIVSDILYNNQISLYNALFSPNEIVIIINNNDAAKVYELLRAKITS